MQVPGMGSQQVLGGCCVVLGLTQVATGPRSLHWKYYKLQPDMYNSIIPHTAQSLHTNGMLAEFI